MNRILLLALTLIIANSALATAATPTLDGPSGLVLTRTAEILDTGEHSLTIFGVMDQHKVDDGEKVTDIRYKGAFHFLIFENLELGVIGSMLQPDTENLSTSETSYVNGIGKVRLAGGRDQGYGITASGYASLNRLKADPLISSGEDIYGGELNVSFFGEGASLHLATGAKQDDVRAFTLVSSTFVYAKQQYITVAIEMTPTPNFSYSLEWMRGKINEKGEWLCVECSSGKVYIQKMFTGDSPAIKRQTSADSLKELSSITTRKRASYYSSSAAATRGFSTENIRDRENVTFKNYDFESIKWLEKFIYTEEELIEFAMKEHLGF